MWGLTLGLCPRPGHREWAERIQTLDCSSFQSRDLVTAGRRRVFPSSSVGISQNHTWVGFRQSQKWVCRDHGTSGKAAGLTQWHVRGYLEPLRTSDPPSWSLKVLWFWPKTLHGPIPWALRAPDPGLQTSLNAHPRGSLFRPTQSESRWRPGVSTTSRGAGPRM